MTVCNKITDDVDINTGEKVRNKINTEKRKIIFRTVDKPLK